MNVHVQPAPKTGAVHFMERGRWLVDVHRRYGPRNYDKINDLLFWSDDRAGGPALRLARCIWLFEEVLAYPSVKKLVPVEENAYAHLCDAHRNSGKAKQYRVWQAMELFAPMREAVQGGPLLTPLEDDDLATADWRRAEAICRIDRAARKVPGGELRRILNDAVYACLYRAPATEQYTEPLAMLGDVVWKWTKWQKGGGHVNDPARETFWLARNALSRHMYANGWLHNTPLGITIDVVKDCLR